MDEALAGNAIDDGSGTQYNGTQVGTVAVITDGFHPSINSRELTTTSDYFTTSYQPTGITKISVSMWVKASTSSINQTFFGQADGAANGINCAVDSIDATQALFGVNTGGGFVNVSSSGATIFDDEWHQITYVWDSGATQKIYVDGVQKGTGSAQTGTFNATSGIYIGALNTGAAANPVGNNTELHAVTVKEGVAWDSAQVLASYNAEKPTLWGLSVSLGISTDEDLICLDTASLLSAGLKTVRGVLLTDTTENKMLSVSSASSINWYATATKDLDLLTAGQLKYYIVYTTAT